MPRPYHPSNLALQPFGRRRVILLAWIANGLGISFHISGIPFGAAPSRSASGFSVGGSEYAEIPVMGQMNPNADNQ